MNRFRYCILCFLFVLPLLVDGQSKKRPPLFIKGDVYEFKTKAVLPLATVRLLNLPDSVFIDGGVTDDKGHYFISIEKRDSLLLEVSYVGYKSVEQKLVLKDVKDTLVISPFYLKTDVHVLDEIVVRERRPAVVVKEDTVEFNVEAYKVPENAVVEDLLKKIPGMEVDKDGNITVYGKKVNRILVDGKPFFGNDKSIALKNINTYIIDKLQVVDKRSERSEFTGIDDGQRETVLNLAIKKGMKHGWFGNANAGYAPSKTTLNKYDTRGMLGRFVDENQYAFVARTSNIPMFGDRSRNTELGGNVNLDLGKTVRLSANVRNANSSSGNSQESFRENMLQDSSTFYNAYSNSSSDTKNLSGDIRLEWNKKQKTRFEITSNFGTNHATSGQNSRYLTTSNELARKGWDAYTGSYINKGGDARTSSTRNYDYTIAANLAHNSTLRKGRMYSINTSYSGNTRNGTTHLNNQMSYDSRQDTTVANEVLTKQRQPEQSNSDRTTLYLTWLEPVMEGGFLQFSYEGQYSFDVSKRNVFPWDVSLGDYAQNASDSLSDHTQNESIQHAIGIGFRARKKKFYYTVGLSVVPSSNDTKNELDDTRSYKEHVVNYAPSISLNYSWGKGKSIRGSYNGNTQQPTIFQRQASKNNTNPLFIQLGNPDLKSSYSSSFSVSYNQYNMEKQSSLVFSLNGGFLLNSITEQTLYNRETGVQTSKPVNVNGQWNMSCNMMFNFSIGKHVYVNNNLSGSYNRNIGFVQSDDNEEILRNCTANYSGGDNLSVTYRNDLIDLSLSGNYQVQYVGSSITTKMSNNTTQNYGFNFSGSFNLPLKFTLSSDFAYRVNNRGGKLENNTEQIWNARASKGFYKNKGTFFIQANDLLNNRKTHFLQVNANYKEDTYYHQSTGYILLGLNYRFGKMGGPR